jgi:thioesterase domain-containing protein
VNASKSYQVEPYPGRLVLLRAAKQPDQEDWTGSRFDDPENGWGPYALGGVETHVIDCTHVDIFDEPAVGDLAQYLTFCLERALKNCG